jgi:tRNA(fMet)-specific endonuclease VapC
MKVLCDTNAITALRLGNSKVIESVEAADTLYLSVIVLAELYHGYAKGSRKEENLQWLKKFMGKPAVQLLHITEETSQVWAQTIVDLNRAGTPVPTNDIWIASQCIEMGAILLTGDSHFSNLIALRKIFFQP